jgi:outer membrane protein TolC
VRLRRLFTAAGFALAASVPCAPGPLQAQEPPPEAEVEPLLLEEVLESVLSFYPPLLAARIQRDVAEGRLLSARSIFDTQLFGKSGGTADGYYEYTTSEVGLQQFLGLWGTTVFGGYRLTEGGELPDYYRNRTQEDGELSFGLRIPLLRGGPVDKGRADLEKARLARRAVEPQVARQRLDFVRAASVAYFRWVAAGRERDLSQELLQVAEDRIEALEQQVQNGLRPEIDLVDNRRLVVSREIGLLRAERDLRTAALTLSLFYRDASGEAIVPSQERLPPLLPTPDAPMPDVDSDLERALRVRPELARLALDVARIEVDLRLARNQLLPSLDANVEYSRDVGPPLYGDLARSELEAAVEFKLPVPRRAASGARAAATSRLDQARQFLRFATDEIAAEVRTVAAELAAARELVERAELNRDLAETLRAAEEVRFLAGGTDLLTLQIREQAAFEAELGLVDSRLELLRAIADYEAAIAEGVELDPGS